MKKAMIIIGSILGVMLLVVVIYVGYVFFGYSRIEDDLILKVEQKAKDSQVETDKEYTAVTFNIGYGAYPPDYTFFMDGGKESKARSKESVNENIDGVVKTLERINADFAVLQEVDEKATRSHGVNEVKMISDSFGDYSAVSATNYDSAYLMYPVLDPIGKSKSGILSLSNTKINSSIRYSLPIETSFNKFFDLDRAFTVSEIDVANGKKMMLYNVHLSAYMKDEEIQKNQIMTLFDHMENEYKNGNYVVCGGDFNHDLLPSSSKTFGNDTSKDYSWLQPFPKEELPEGLAVTDFTDDGEPVPSTRNLDTPYEKGKSFVALIDGFIVSDNVEALETKVLDESFQYSDHHPVTMTFKLKESN
ncbi:endonuclease/exonuclease/phosphatase family protein [Enterococcus sp. CWB-B31]|uniref:endonuclease/exonuclease/phosphatase family protein n=1 Tax=Enterococcus sp. CWB-B31 TaxID=2885159 RepID=UPI001E4AF438|nr:endonuclease/exonuclease/phosphatase family protein [Enterococcus sp. CWB-B31]MCB5955449.1 hydrolase [Enterococcus sp. CWB-B31]